jgi:hypothetical protein
LIEADLIPLPVGWTSLEKHLIYWHGWEPESVFAMDSDGLRRAHEASHVHERFSFERYHLHFIAE